MRLDIIGKNGFVPTGALKEYALKRLKKVDSFFGENIVNEIRVVFKNHKDHYKVEVTVYAKTNILRAEIGDNDLYRAIDLAVDKLVEQIRRYKSKLKNNLEKEGLSEVYSKEFDIESLEKEVLATQLVKSKKIELKPMDSEEAIVAMELVGHSFYVYLDKNTGKTNVIYRREDGDYAVIETEAR